MTVGSTAEAAVWPSVFTATRPRLEADLARPYGCQSVTLTPLRYIERPFSHVLRLEVRDGETGASVARAYVKQLKPKADLGDDRMRARVAHEFDTTSMVHGALAGLDDVGTIRPLVHYPEALTLVTEEVAGRTLLEVLQQRVAWFPSGATVADVEQTMGTIGRWLAAFQHAGGEGGRVCPDDIRRYIEARLDTLVATRRAGFDAADRLALLAHVDRLLAVLQPQDLQDVLVHADFAHGNVLVDRQRITVLDFAMAHRGTRLQDITRLHMQLDLLRAKPWFRPRVISRLQAALRAGFDPSLRPDAPLFRLQTLVHRVNNLATLSVRPSAFPASLYDARVRRHHRRWLDEELRRPAGHGEEA